MKGSFCGGGSLETKQQPSRRYFPIGCRTRMVDVVELTLETVPVKAFIWTMLFSTTRVVKHVRPEGLHGPMALVLSGTGASTLAEGTAARARDES